MEKGDKDSGVDGVAAGRDDREQPQTTSFLYQKE